MVRFCTAVSNTYDTCFAQLSKTCVKPFLLPPSILSLFMARPPTTTTRNVCVPPRRLSACVYYRRGRLLSLTLPRPPPCQEVNVSAREGRVLYSTGDFETLNLEETARDMHMVSWGVG